MITAIVPARSGSKRLPGKNIKLLKGRPLIFHTLDALLNHQQISKIVFSSDSDSYIDLVRKEYDNSVDVEKRPKHFASDTTKVHDEIVRLSDTGVIDTEWFMLCLPTSPLRTFKTIQNLLSEWSVDKCARFSASPYAFPIQFAFEINSQSEWTPIFEDSPMLTGNTRSQDIQSRYRPNGAIYLQKVLELYESKTFYINAKPFLINEIESTDVDSEIDFKVAEALMDVSEHAS